MHLEKVFGTCMGEFTILGTVPLIYLLAMNFLRGQICSQTIADEFVLKITVTKSENT